MTEPPGYCLCRDGGPRWVLAGGDRYCGRCGRARDQVESLDPLLAAGTVPTVACYLKDPAGGPANRRDPAPTYARLRFQVTGRFTWPPRLQWEPEGEPMLALDGWRSPHPGQFELRLRTAGPLAPSAGPPGLYGRGLLRIEAEDGEPWSFAVRAFARGGDRGDVRVAEADADGNPRGPWLSVVEGRAPRLSLYRGGPPFVSRLEYRLAPDGVVPIAWKAASASHPAVQIELDRGATAGPVARALLRWDVDRLASDDESLAVPLVLHALGLEPEPILQPINWRLWRPLGFRPAALALPALPAHRTRVFQITVTNRDKEPIRLLGTESDRPWLRDGTPGAERHTLAPGESAPLRIELDPAQLTGREGPHHARLAVRLEGRDRQGFPVRVDRLLDPRVWETPLLVDPGPPRIVVAAWDSSRGALAYLRRSGSRGLPPEALGVASLRYAEAVYGGAAAGGVVQDLVTSARDLAREECLWEFRRVRVCRPPWVPQSPPQAAPRLEFLDWTTPDDGVPDPPGTVVVHVSAWDLVVATTGVKAQQRRLVPRRGEPVNLGPVLLQRLVERLDDRRRAREVLARPQPLQRACEEFLVDRVQGPSLAWYHLAQAVRAVLGQEIALGPMDSALTLGLDEAGRALLERVGRAVAQAAGRRAGRIVCRLVGPLARGLASDPMLCSIGDSVGLTFHAASADWLAQHAAGMTGVSSGP
jgi:hypothetical protein